MTLYNRDMIMAVRQCILVKFYGILKPDAPARGRTPRPLAPTEKGGRRGRGGRARWGAPPRSLQYGGPCAGRGEARPRRGIGPPAARRAAPYGGRTRAAGGSRRHATARGFGPAAPDTHAIRGDRGNGPVTAPGMYGAGPEDETAAGKAGGAGMYNRAGRGINNAGRE